MVRYIYLVTYFLCFTFILSTNCFAKDLWESIKFVKPENENEDYFVEDIQKDKLLIQKRTISYPNKGVNRPFQESSILFVMDTSNSRIDSIMYAGSNDFSISSPKFSKDAQELFMYISYRDSLYVNDSLTAVYDYPQKNNGLFAKFNNKKEIQWIFFPEVKYLRSARSGRIIGQNNKSDVFTSFNYQRIDSLSENYVKNVVYTKFSSSGQIQWQREIEYNLVEISNPITFLSDNNLYCATAFKDSIKLESKTIKSKFNESIIVLKFDTDGNILWHKQINKDSIIEEKRICKGEDGNLYLALMCINDVAFDDKVIKCAPLSLDDVNSLRNYGRWLIIKFDDNGEILNAGSTGIYGSNRVDFMRIDSNGNVFFQGIFSTLYNEMASKKLTNDTYDRYFEAVFDSDLNLIEYKICEETFPARIQWMDNFIIREEFEQKKDCDDVKYKILKADLPLLLKTKPVE